MPFRCEAKGHHSFVIGQKTGHISGRDGIFRSHGQKIGPFPGRHSSRRNEPLGCSSRSLLRIAGWPLPAMVPYITHSAHLDQKSGNSLPRCVHFQPFWWIFHTPWRKNSDFFAKVYKNGLPMWIERPYLYAFSTGTWMIVNHFSGSSWFHIPSTYE